MNECKNNSENSVTIFLKLLVTSICAPAFGSVPLECVHFCVISCRIQSHVNFQRLAAEEKLAKNVTGFHVTDTSWLTPKSGSISDSAQTAKGQNNYLSRVVLFLLFYFGKRLTVVLLLVANMS